MGCKPGSFGDRPSRRVVAWSCAFLTAFNLFTGLLYGFSHWAGPSDGRIAAFDLDREGSLNAWLHSTCLLLTAELCLVMAALAAWHRGSLWARGWWGWSAVVFLMMSADEGGSLHEAFKELCVRLTGARWYGDGSLYWVAPYSLVLGITWVALWRYVRVAPAARLLLATAAACYSAAAAAQLECFWPTEDPAEIVLEELLEVQGSVFCATAVAMTVVSRLAGPRRLASDWEICRAWKDVHLLVLRPVASGAERAAAAHASSPSGLVTELACRVTGKPL
jgi:hypothetical protein